MINVPFLYTLYFTSEDETPAHQKLERKWYDISLGEKIIYIDIGYKSTQNQTDKWRKDTKGKENTVIYILPLWIKSLALT